MYPIPLGGIIAITVEYQAVNIVRMFNTFHYTLTGSLAVDDGAAAINALINQNFTAGSPAVNWPDQWASMASPNVQIVAVRGQMLFPTRFRIVEKSTVQPGVRTGDALPQVSCWTITKKGLLANRHGIGSLRVPGLVDTDEAGGVTVEAIRPNLQGIADFLPLPLVTNAPVATWTPVIFNRLQPAVSAPIISAVAQFTIRSQRTRIAFRGV